MVYRSSINSLKFPVSRIFGKFWIFERVFFSMRCARRQWNGKKGKKCFERERLKLKNSKFFLASWVLCCLGKGFDGKMKITAAWTEQRKSQVLEKRRNQKQFWKKKETYLEIGVCRSFCVNWLGLGVCVCFVFEKQTRSGFVFFFNWILKTPQLQCTFPWHDKLLLPRVCPMPIIIECHFQSRRMKSRKIACQNNGIVGENEKCETERDVTNWISVRHSLK